MLRRQLEFIGMRIVPNLRPLMEGHDVEPRRDDWRPWLRPDLHGIRRRSRCRLLQPYAQTSQFFVYRHIVALFPQEVGSRSGLLAAGLAACYARDEHRG